MPRVKTRTIKFISSFVSSFVKQFNAATFIPLESSFVKHLFGFPFQEFVPFRHGSLFQAALVSQSKILRCFSLGNSLFHRITAPSIDGALIHCHCVRAHIHWARLCCATEQNGNRQTSVAQILRRLCHFVHELNTLFHGSPPVMSTQGTFVSWVQHKHIQVLLLDRHEWQFFRHFPPLSITAPSQEKQVPIIPNCHYRNWRPPLLGVLLCHVVTVRSPNLVRMECQMVVPTVCQNCCMVEFVFPVSD